MTRLLVVFGGRAAAEIAEIAEWWRANRSSAPELFLAELRQALALVETAPALGVPARSARIPGVRRVLLERTRYHVYFRVNADCLEVLAVWHASRGGKPKI
jgi:plasmid stabilization system protein ParE